MKNINKIIHLKILEIAVLVFIVAISFPVWKKLEGNNYLTTAAFYNKANYAYLEITDNQWNNMFPIKDEEAIKNLKPTQIKVKNDTKTKEDYTLLLKISKESTLDYNCLNIALNNEISPLKDHFLLEDQNDIYFSLDSYSVLGSPINYDFLMWMDKNTDNNMQGKTLKYSFEIQEKIAI